jgi:hypothetical protein
LRLKAGVHGYKSLDTGHNWETSCTVLLRMTVQI